MLRSMQFLVEASAISSVEGLFLWRGYRNSHYVSQVLYVYRIV